MQSKGCTFLFLILLSHNNSALNQEVHYNLPNSITLLIKRDDLLHPYISGNKFRKLKYNLIEAKKLGFEKLLTFGGAYSNHIAATAAAGKEMGFSTVGVIRGEELKSKTEDNPTLSLAVSNGMELLFVSREDYRRKDSQDFQKQLKQQFGKVYVLPEGGTNELAVKGCEEILVKEDLDVDYICCAVGTGGTISGLINASGANQRVLGFPALKGSFLSDDIRKFAKKDNWELVHGYEFGGYGKISSELVRFLNEFYQQTGIPLDPLYTGKMMFGVMDRIAKGAFPDGAKILAIHTGGLQGIKGMNQLLLQKEMPTINY